MKTALVAALALVATAAVAASSGFFRDAPDRNLDGAVNGAGVGGMPIGLCVYSVVWDPRAPQLSVVSASPLAGTDPQPQCNATARQALASGAAQF